MKLIVTNDEGEAHGVLTAVESFDLSNPMWRQYVVAWIQEVITKGEQNDG